MSIGLDFILRAKTSIFTNGLANANNKVEDLKKSLKHFDVGNGLKQALGVGGVIEGFRLIIESAQEMRDKLKEANMPISDSIRSVAEYGDEWDGLKKKVGETSVSILSFFTRAGEGYGMLINRMRGVTAEQEKIGEAAAKGAEENEKALAKLRAEEAGKIKDRTEKLADQNKRNSYDELSTQEKFNSLLDERVGLMDEIAKMQEGSAKQAKKLQLAELHPKIKKMGEDLQKERDDASEKGQADARAQGELADKQMMERHEAKRKLVETFAPSVEDLAAKNAGGFFDANSPVIRAKQILDQENKAKALFDKGDFRGGLALAEKAQGMRNSLSMKASGTGALTPQAAQEAVTKGMEVTNGKLDMLNDSVHGIIKAQK